MPNLLVTYNAYSEFIIPKGVKLMSPEDNAGAKEGDVGSWYIKHNTLFYIDAQGYEEYISGSDPDVDAKRPKEVEEVKED